MVVAGQVAWAFLSREIPVRNQQCDPRWRPRPSVVLPPERFATFSLEVLLTLRSLRIVGKNPEYSENRMYTGQWNRTLIRPADCRRCDPKRQETCPLSSFGLCHPTP